MNKACRYLLQSLLIGVLSTSAKGGDAVDSSAELTETSVVTSASVVSQYLFRGQHLNGSSFEPSFELDTAHSFIGLWSNVPFDSKRRAGDDDGIETDLYGSYIIEIAHNIDLAPGFTLYDYPKRQFASRSHRTAFEPNLALDWTIRGVKLTPKVYDDFIRNQPTFELSASASFPLKKIGSEIELTSAMGASYLKMADSAENRAIRERDEYWTASAALPFQMSSKAKITIGWAYTKGWEVYPRRRFPNPSSFSAANSGVVSISYFFAF